MAKEDNLIPFDSNQNREEAKKNGKKGGKASGVARRKKKEAREYLITVLEGKVKTKDGSMTTVKDVMMQKLVGKALGETDLNTIKYILDLIGEGTTQKVELTGKDGKDLMPQRLSHDEAKKIISELENEY